MNNEVNDIEDFFTELKESECKYWTLEMIDNLLDAKFSHALRIKNIKQYNYFIKNRMKTVSIRSHYKGKKYLVKSFDYENAIASAEYIKNNIDEHLCDM